MHCVGMDAAHKRQLGDVMPGGIKARSSLVLGLLAALALSGCAGGEDTSGATPTGASPSPTAASPSPGTGDTASASFLDPEGAEAGTVDLRFDGDRTTVVVEASGLAPGPHGFHIHAIGRCEPDSTDPAEPTRTGDFLSAGGHLAKEGQVHGAHDGDLPSLIVAEDGTARMTVTTDSLSAQDVLDSDGSAVMIHALADNFRNVPERYAPEGPDETTNKTGDSGGRIACAELTSTD
jgi:Cu-Zn family superoxide dismutase